jgi:hypothetical protein
MTRQAGKMFRFVFYSLLLSVTTIILSFFGSNKKEARYSESIWLGLIFRHPLLCHHRTLLLLLIQLTIVLPHHLVMVHKIVHLPPSS